MYNEESLGSWILAREVEQLLDCFGPEAPAGDISAAAPAGPAAPELSAAWAKLSRIPSALSGDSSGEMTPQRGMKVQ